MAVLVLAALAPAASAAALTCELHEAIAYATYTDAAGVTKPLLMDLMIPVDAAGATPLVLWIHGGGWQSGTRAPMPTRAAMMCPLGYAVASIDYRFTNVARWPAQIQDVKGAVRWLRAHAATYNIDPRRFAAWGNSSGAQLAAVLGTTGGLKTTTIGNVTVDLEGTVGGNTSQSSRVQAVVTWYGLFDFLQERFYPLNRDAEASGSYEGKLIGGRVQDFPERSATANPITFVSDDDPPFLVMHGSSDVVSPFNQSELLVDALTDGGVPARLYPVVGAQHAASYFDTATHRQAAHDFIAAALANPPASPPATPGATVTPGGVRIEAIDAAASEAGDPGRLRVTRGGSTANALTVTFTVTGTATHAADYVHLSRTITIPSGAASATLDVAPLQDDLREPSETVIVTLAASSSYALDAPRTASVAIRDDDNDSGRPTVSVSAIDREAAEPGSDTGRFMLTRTGSTANALTVALRLDGTAQNGVDFSAVPTTATFASGVNRLTIAVQPRADALTEGPEDVRLTVVPSDAIYVGPYARAEILIADRVEAPAPLPTGWQADDVGAVGVAGSADERDGTFTVSGAGADVWGTADAFHFAYRPLTGDGTILARVASVAGAQAWTKAGVMIRASTSAGAAHAFMIVSTGKGLAFQRRTANGAVSTHTSGGTGTAPRWVRLVRAGTRITASTSLDGTSWVTAGSDTFAMPATVLVGVAVSSHDPARLATATFDHLAIGAAATAPALPTGWDTRDIGAVGRAGAASERNGAFTVTGAGADVWGTADALHFTSRVLAGDGAIVARVAALSGTQAWTKVGVMIRESLDPASAHAFMIVSKGKGLAFQRRVEFGGISTNTAGGAGTAPRWVRLVRVGQQITASVSQDGVSWNVVGVETFAMAGAVYAGLAVSSHDPAVLASATFDGVAVTPAASP